MCDYYLLELLGDLPGPSPQEHIARWFIVFSQWLRVRSVIMRQGKLRPKGMFSSREGSHRTLINVQFQPARRARDEAASRQM